LYDSKENAVRPQRSKEESHDYRYFPEPDLPPLVLTPEFVAEQQSELPELPAAKRDRFVATYALSREHATVVTSDRAVADYYENVVRAGGEPKLMAFFVGQVMRASKGKADPKLAQRVLEEKLTAS